MRQLCLRIPDMVCDACAASIRRTLEPLPGLADLAIDPETKEVRVSLDENQTLVSQVIDRIRQAGFDVEEH